MHAWHGARNMPRRETRGSTWPCVFNVDGTRRNSAHSRACSQSSQKQILIPCRPTTRPRAVPCGAAAALGLRAAHAKTPDHGQGMTRASQVKSSQSKTVPSQVKCSGLHKIKCTVKSPSWPPPCSCSPRQRSALAPTPAGASSTGRTRRVETRRRAQDGNSAGSLVCCVNARAQIHKSMRTLRTSCVHNVAGIRRVS